MSAHREKRVRSDGKGSKVRKSFDKNSKDFDSGRIGRLDDDTMGYYRRVSEAITEGFPDQTEKEMFISNVFAQVEKDELKISQNQTVSHILEKMMEMSNGIQLCGFLNGLLSADDICNAAKDRFAGHVLQTAIIQAVPFVDDPDCGSQVQTVLLAVCKEVCDKLTEFLYHTYAAHVLSAVIEVLAGVRVPEQISRSRLSQGQMHAKDHGRAPQPLLKVTPASFLEELKKMSQAILDIDNFVDVLLNPVASPVIAVLMLVLKLADVDMCKAVCKAVIKACKLQTKQLNEGIPPAMLTHPIASHVMEILVQATTDKQFNKLCSTCFSGRYKQLALHPTANHVLQRVISRAVHMDVFEELFAELSICIEDMMAVNHFGVVIRLAEACVLRPAQQGQLMLALMKGFHCCEPKQRQSTCVLLMVSMTTYDVYFNVEEETKEGEATKEGESADKVEPPKRSLKVNYHGSLLIQNLLKFKNCGSVSAGFIAMTPDDLVAMSCDASGSFLLDAFMASGVNEKKKDKLIDKLKGHYLKVACNRNGSRTIDSFFSAASMRSKFTIVEELAAKDSQLLNDEYGRHVHRNCAINHFKYRRGQWKELQGRETKKRKLFADIIGVEGHSTKKPKKKKQAGPSDVYFKEMVVLGIGVGDEHGMDAPSQDGNSQDASGQGGHESDDELQDIFSKMPKPKTDKSRTHLKHQHKQSIHQQEQMDNNNTVKNETRTSSHETSGKKKHKHAKKERSLTESISSDIPISEEAPAEEDGTRKHRKRKNKHTDSDIDHADSESVKQRTAVDSDVSNKHKKKKNKKKHVSEKR